MIELKDYIGYYVGQPYKLKNDTSGEVFERINHEYLGTNGFTEVIIPILRRLEDITDEEKIEFYDCNHEHNHKWNHKDKLNHFAIMRRRDSDTWVAKEFHYLIKQGFDLFGLIDAGLAIDKKTLNP